MTISKNIPATQKDRDLAAEFVKDLIQCDDNRQEVKDTRSGKKDNTLIVQKIIRFRMAGAVDGYLLGKKEALRAIADLPIGRTEEIMEGQEAAYRAVEVISLTGEVPQRRSGKWWNTALNIFYKK